MKRRPPRTLERIEEEEEELPQTVRLSLIGQEIPKIPVKTLKPKVVSSWDCRKDFENRFRLDEMAWHGHSRLHRVNLKQYLKLGMKLLKVYKGIKCKEETWMKSYIEKNTALRMKANNFFKLLNNSVLSKTMENIRKRVYFRLVSKKETARKMTSLPNFKHLTIFDENLAAVHLQRVMLVFDKPVYIGAAILHLRKKLNVMRSRNHEIFSETVEKVALSCENDKRFIKEDGIETFACGHKRISNTSYLIPLWEVFSGFPGLTDHQRWKFPSRSNDRRRRDYAN